MDRYLESADEPEAALDEQTAALDAPEAADTEGEQGDAGTTRPYYYPS